MPTKYINWPRLAFGSAALAAILLPLYVFVLSRDRDASLRPGILLDTRAAAGAGVEEGRRAPDFELSRPDGSRFRLSDLRGRPVLINFWARWCTSCLSEMPVIKALQEERGGDAFAVVAVNAGETRQQALEFIDFLAAPFIYGLDFDLTVADGYGVYGLPLSVFVDASGVVQAVYRGHAERPLLERFIDAAIAAHPAGPVPPILRIVNTIPRQRVLTVERRGTRAVLTSRAFRCDTAYCAGGLLDEIGALEGILSVDSSRAASENKLFLRLNPDADLQDLAGRIAGLIEAQPDPLYEGEIRLELTDR